MKPLSVICNQEPVYLGDFAGAGYKDGTEDGSCPERVFEEFEYRPGKEKILFASCYYEDYEGDTFVLFTLEGELFEVNGSYCSYNGLKEQWEPERTTLAELEARMNDVVFESGYRSELIEFIGAEVSS